MANTFFLRKMRHEGRPELRYYLNDISLNELVGQEIRLKATGRICCINCNREIKKTFQQGYCYPCFQSLARCDLCILKPELCHYRLGTCREPEWAKDNCLRPHVVYLANTTGLKVGVTREHKKFERWGDQGALAAIELARVPERYVAGLLEVSLAKVIADKSDWRELITGRHQEVDLLSEKEQLISEVPEEFEQYISESTEIVKLLYPVKKYPAKAKVVSLEKTPEVVGTLQGVRGQYIFIGEAAINIRKYGGYEVEWA